jgi:hypothetical protein
MRWATGDERRRSTPTDCGSDLTNSAMSGLTDAIRLKHKPFSEIG